MLQHTGFNNMLRLRRDIVSESTILTSHPYQPTPLLVVQNHNPVYRTEHVYNPPYI